VVSQLVFNISMHGVFFVMLEILKMLSKEWLW